MEQALQTKLTIIDQKEELKTKVRNKTAVAVVTSVVVVEVEAVAGALLEVEEEVKTTIKVEIKDDLIVTGSSPQMIKPFKEAMAKAFDMTDMGIMSYFLDLEVKQGVDGIFMT
ncbi:hypothetical protein ZIOFF_022213 [Zingiber officinale]|uniref:Reverse transcriptase Ty1/copia-type domain-containing protein n=1 Tax=Zingiber officinale TaxID=94328 RepID=A0A8J5LH31_ZINOF|nr:hypothetical protein ZIOFF_022213 [Zingiber officinale]